MNWKLSIKKADKGSITGAVLAVVLGVTLLAGDVIWKENHSVTHPPRWPRLHWVHIPFVENLMHISYDLPFRYRALPSSPTEVVLVYLDDDSFLNLNQPYDGPWDRGLYGRFVERMTAEKAKAVTFDIIFSDPNTRYPEGDERFAKAIKENGKVFLAGDYEPTAGGGMQFVRAMPAFSDVSAGWGMIQLNPDQDFVVRQPLHVPTVEDDNRSSSISWVLARVAGVLCAQDLNERYVQRWNNYYGPPGTIPNISFLLALETNSSCPAGFFSNKVVIVGSSLKTLSANSRKDELRTPYTLREFCPAVDVHATQTLNLIRGDWLTRTSYTTEFILLTLTGILFGAGLSLFRPLPALGLAVVSGFLVMLIAVMIFQNQRVWFPWSIIVAVQIPIALLWSVVFNSVRLFVQNQLYEHSLRMYLPPKLVKKFANNRSFLTPGAEKHELTLMFSDIADFTSISEGMDPDELAHLMNAYFQAVVGSCIHEKDGTLVKYIGDAIFAFWNAPERQQDHALLACEAALLFRKMNEVEIRGHRLHTRIGLHSGVANVGNFGSDERVDYTALGENVNLASRLESLNKYTGTDCLISGQTNAELKGRLITRFLGKFQLKGFESLVEVYELVCLPEQQEESRSWRELFADALLKYQERDLVSARMGFNRVLEIRPKDGPTLFYLRNIEERSKEVLPNDWKTHVILKEK